MLGLDALCAQDFAMCSASTGTAGQFEFMMESILYAQGKALFWDNASEFNLSALKSLAIKEFSLKPK